MTVETSNHAELLANLETSLEELRSRLAEHEAKRREIANQLKRMAAMRDSLATDKTRSTSPARKSAATRDEVVAIISTLLGERGPCHEEIIKEAVEAKVVAADKSRTGLSLRINEALQSTRFAKTDGEYRLADEANDTANQSDS